MRIRVDTTPRSPGIRHCGDQRIIPLAGQVPRLQVVEAATTIEVDRHRRLEARQVLVLRLVIGIIPHRGIDRITPLPHRMRGPGRHLVVGTTQGVGLRVALMPGMIGGISRPRLCLLHEGLRTAV